MGREGLLEFCVPGALSGWGTAELERSQRSPWAHLPGVQPVPAARRLLPAPGHCHCPHGGLGHRGTALKQDQGRSQHGGDSQGCSARGSHSRYQRAPMPPHQQGHPAGGIWALGCSEHSEQHLGMPPALPCPKAGRCSDPQPCPARRAGCGECKPLIKALIKHSPIPPGQKESKVHSQSTEGWDSAFISRQEAPSRAQVRAQSKQQRAKSELGGFVCRVKGLGTGMMPQVSWERPGAVQMPAAEGNTRWK